MMREASSVLTRDHTFVIVFALFLAGFFLVRLIFRPRDS